MNANILLMSASLFYLVLIAILYFPKEKMNTFDTRIYKYILIIAIFGVIMDMIGVYVSINVDDTHIIRWIVLKSYYSYLLAIMYLLSSYMFIRGNQPSLDKKDKKKFNILTIIFSIIFIINLFLPVKYFKDGSVIYAYGIGTDFLYYMTGVVLFSWIVYLIKDRNINKLKNKKYLPMIIFILLIIPIVLIQMLNPELLLVSGLLSFIVVFMYHTIENPDLQMIREFHKAREYANNLNTEKSEFLFNMAGEIKTPISVINRISKEVLMQDDINVIKSKVNDIKYSSNNLLELVNKVLDINSLEKRKVSVRESKYNTTNLFKGIESQTELKLNNDLVKFRTNYDKSIPNELYGDSVRIRQIVNTLLENAIKYTKEGFIELSVNSIVKHDICRLVITVEDSGVGMTQDVVEHLFDKKLDKIEEIDNPKMDLGLAKTLLDLIGGTIIVNSELNHGTKFTIVLDQKVVNHKKNKTIEAVEKYEEMYLNNKKVMCVINDDTLSKKINTLFKKYQLDIEIVKLGQSCLEKVRAGEKLDLIIMEEHLEKLSSENTLVKLKSIQGFKTPVILLTDKKDINEKEEYLKLGFTEIVTLPLKKEQVEELVNNYIND